MPAAAQCDLNQCYTVYQTPYVTVEAPDSAYPFKLALRQAGSSVYSFKKSASTSAYWSYQGGTSVSPHPYGASLGAFSWWDGNSYSSELVMFYAKSAM